MNDDQYAEIHAQLAANEIEHKEMKRRLDNHSSSMCVYPRQSLQRVSTHLHPSQADCFPLKTRQALAIFSA